MIQGGMVLIIPFSKGNLLETLPVARALMAEKSLEPLYYVDPKRADAMLPVLAEEGFMAVAPAGKSFLPVRESFNTAEPDEPDEDFEAPRQESARKKVFRLMPEFFQLLRHHRSLRRRARSILDRHPGIKVLLLASDRKVGIETAFVRAANERGIPGLILPFAASFPEAIAEVRFREADFRKKYAVAGLRRALLAWMYPRWVYRHKGNRMFFRPPNDCLAARCCGMMPPNPWTLGGGFAERMTVDSEQSLEAFVAQGTAREKMVVTGRPSTDDIARTLRDVDPSVIRKELGIPDGKRVILCSVPQLAEHDLLPWDKHWEELGYLFRTMAAAGAAVVLSLHPKSDPEKYRSHAAAEGAIVATRRVYELLPACDIFVASYSSIVAQAIALQKPCIVVDFWGLGYPIYDSAPGTTVVREKKDFAPLLHRLLSDEGFYADQQKEQEKDGARWAVLDGGCTQRVKEELLRLAARTS